MDRHDIIKILYPPKFMPFSHFFQKHKPYILESHKVTNNQVFIMFYFQDLHKYQSQQITCFWLIKLVSCGIVICFLDRLKIRNAQV